MNKSSRWSVAPAAPQPAAAPAQGSGNQQYANSGSEIEDVGLDDDGFFSDDDSFV